VILRVPCPGCGTNGARRGRVAVGTAAWSTPGGPRRSVWVDEPARCTAGCPLSAAQVAQLLTRVARDHPFQLPLPEGLEQGAAILTQKLTVGDTSQRGAA
jgi:hypothetical protein